MYGPLAALGFIAFFCAGTAFADDLPERGVTI
jgi:hypothetical protein